MDAVREGDARRLVLVAVGTDHHPFDRLIDWVDEWIRAEPSEEIRCIVQTGTSRPPRSAEWHDCVPNEQLQRWMKQAVVVVSHGGPGTIMDSRRAGSVPIVVPRQSAGKEHVDDHQVRFARRMAAAGLILLAETEADFRDHLRRALEGGTAVSENLGNTLSSNVLDEFERLVDRLLSDLRPRGLWRHPFRRRGPAGQHFPPGGSIRRWTRPRSGTRRARPPSYLPTRGREDPS